jgi:uncharacterized protein
VDREQVIATLTRLFANTEESLVAAYLFGSVARGRTHAASDVDVGLLYRSRLASTLEAQPFELEARLQAELACNVQLVVMNTAPTDLVHRILRDGILVLDRDKSQRIAFEVQSRNQYFDMQRIWAEYRRPRSAP